MRRVHLDWVSLGAALLGEVALLLILDVAVGLRPAAWVVAFGTQLIVVLVLVRGLTRSRSDLGPANMVTLTRATLTCAVAGIAVQSLADPAPRQAVILLAGPALALDAVDGWLARRTRSETLLGARFDMETDALLFLPLSGYVARDVGWWVLLIGLARYMLLGAQGIWPVLRGPVAPRRWRKVVAAIQGVVLLVAASGMLPSPISMAILVGALVLLVASFAGEVRERMAGQSRPTNWSSPTASRSLEPSALQAGVPSSTSPPSLGTGRRDPRSRASTPRTTPATSDTAVRSSVTPPCPTASDPLGPSG